MCGSDWEILSCGGRSAEPDSDTFSIVDVAEQGPTLLTEDAGSLSVSPTTEERAWQQVHIPMQAETEAPDAGWELAVQALVASAGMAGVGDRGKAQEASSALHLGNGPDRAIADAAALMAAWVERRAAEVRADADAKVACLSQHMKRLENRLAEPRAKRVEQVASSLELSGFQRQALNTRYYRSPSLRANGRETYWSADWGLVVFLARQGRYWGVAAAEDYDRVLAGKETVGFGGKWRADLKGSADLASSDDWEEWYVKDSFRIRIPKQQIRMTVHW